MAESKEELKSLLMKVKEESENVGLKLNIQKTTLVEGMATHSSILAWRILMDRGAQQAAVHGLSKSWTRLRN